ncbi:MAG TPA: DUF2336 domain-containing protein [Allosphingosinicella sp.]|nr:DUF2336 domain-containing protein [Allosphingosinicella sp.]
MSEVRSNGGERDGAAQLLAASRARVSAAATDLALPERLRLSDRQRSALAHLVSRLIGDIEDEIRSALLASVTGAPVRAALSSAAVPIALPILETSGLLSDPALIALLLRRAEEHRLARGRDGALLTELSGDPEEAVSAAAISLIVAQSRRLDAFQEPLVGSVDLPAELLHMIAWTVAAAIRRYLVQVQNLPGSDADEAVAAAVSRLLAGCDEGDGVDAQALRLARLLGVRARLDDAFVARAAEEGALPLFLAALSLRAEIDFSAAWEILAEPSGRGAVILLKGAGVMRQPAVSALLALAEREEPVAAQLDLFDTLSDDEARRLVSLWRRDPAYRGAVARLAA